MMMQKIYTATVVINEVQFTVEYEYLKEEKDYSHHAPAEIKIKRIALDVDDLLKDCYDDIREQIMRQHGDN